MSVLEADYERPTAEDITKAIEAGLEESEAKGKLIRDAEGLNEWIEIGFYDKDPGETFGDEWIKLERVHITEAKTELSFDIDTKPSYIVLDPRRLLIERDVDDNEIKVPTSQES